MFPDKNPDAVRSHYLPSLINGDLDSVRPDVLNFYSTHGVEVRDLSHDQMCTDLQKCITYVQDEMVPEASAPPEAGSSGVGGMALPTIVAVGAHGGRLDHILSNLSTLHTFKHLNIVLCGDGNLTRLVPAGKAFIQPFRAFEGPSCGLVPLQGAAVATTRGLRWNLDATRMEIGGLVSTSNIIDNDEIWVETDSDLIWTTELRSNPKPA